MAVERIPTGAYLVGERIDLGNGSFGYRQSTLSELASTFGPITQTLTGPNQMIALPCAGAASVLIEVTGTWTGGIGSFNSADASTSVVSPARLWQTGVGSNARSVLAGTGAAYTNEYRAVAGGFLYLMRTAADFVGSATVTLFATQASAISFVHGAIHDSDEEALRAGRAYTTTTGIATVSGGNHLVLYMQNPAGSGQRIFIDTRRFSAARQDNLLAVSPQYYGIGNPTGNIPASVATVSNRGQGGASALVGRFAVVNDANLPTGGTIAAGNLATTPDLPFARTLEPGTSFCQVMSNTSSAGLGGAFNISMVITAAFYQEPI